MRLLFNFPEWSRISPARALIAIALPSLGLRAVCAIWFSGMIDAEGAEYARIAQNLLAGVGYVGIATEGEQLFFPPLFPFLIAAVTVLTGDAEVAGRIISVVMGSLVVVPVYLIAQRMYDERVAIVAAALVGAHPFLVQMSTTVYCETTYLTVVLMAIYMTMRSMDRPTPAGLLFMGALYGLAYLVRPEALAYMLVGVGFLALLTSLRRDQRRIGSFGRLFVGVLAFSLLAAPYIVWLSVQTGQFRVQGKGPVNLVMEKRIQQGVSVDEVSFGVDPDLTARGVWMQPSIKLIKEYNLGIADVAILALKRAKVVAMDASATLAGSLTLGSPFLFALTVLGLFARPWPKQLAVLQAYIAAILALVPFGLLFTYVLGLRFYILFVPFFCIWAVVGVKILTRWAKRSAAMSGLSRVYQDRAACAVQILAILAIIAPSGASAIQQLNATRDERPFKEAIARLSSSQAAPMRVAAIWASPAFHARADFVWLPYSDEVTALRFLAEERVTHVMLMRDLYNNPRPYVKKWMEEGIPGARPIVDITSAGGNRFKVFRFER